MQASQRGAYNRTQKRNGSLRRPCPIDCDMLLPRGSTQSKKARNHASASPSMDPWAFTFAVPTATNSTSSRTWRASAASVRIAAHASKYPVILTRTLIRTSTRLPNRRSQCGMFGRRRANSMAPPTPRPSSAGWRKVVYRPTRWSGAKGGRSGAPRHPSFINFVPLIRRRTSRLSRPRGQVRLSNVPNQPHLARCPKRSPASHPKTQRTVSLVARFADQLGPGTASAAATAWH